MRVVIVSSGVKWTAGNVERFFWAIKRKWSNTNDIDYSSSHLPAFFPVLT